MDIDEMLQGTDFIDELDAELFADRTVSPVGPHYELGLKPLTPTCLTVSEGDRYMVSILPDIGMPALHQTAKFTCQNLAAQQLHKIVLREMRFLGRTVFFNRRIGKMVDHTKQRAG